MVETERKVLCMLGRHSTAPAVSPSPPDLCLVLLFPPDDSHELSLLRIVMQLKNEMISFVSRALFSSDLLHFIKKQKMVESVVVLGFGEETCQP